MRPKARTACLQCKTAGRANPPQKVRNVQNAPPHRVAGYRRPDASRAAMSVQWLGRSAKPPCRRWRRSPGVPAGRFRWRIVPTLFLAWRLFDAAAFEIGSTNFRPLEQFPAISAKRDLAIDHDIAPMRELERMESILLDQEYRKFIASVQFADRGKNLRDQEGRESE